MANMLNFILNASHKYRSYERYILQLVTTRYTITPEIDWQDITGLSLSAYIIRGAWVVSCECGETLFYEPDKGYFCPNCLNADNGHKVRPVLMPEEKSLIEMLLLKRPNPLNRNWLVGESVAQLVAENILAGLEELPA